MPRMEDFLIAVKSDLVCTPIQGLWAYDFKAAAFQSKVYPNFIYRPSNCISEESDQNVIEKLSKIRSDHTITEFHIAGVFNLPDIIGTTCQLYHINIQLVCLQIYLDIATHCGNEQIVRTLARGENILDLFFTSHLILVDKYNTIQGVGNYDVLLVDILDKPQLGKQLVGKSTYWNKVNLSIPKEEITIFVFDFVSQPSDNIKKYIPYNLTRFNTRYHGSVLKHTDLHYAKSLHLKGKLYQEC